VTCNTYLPAFVLWDFAAAFPSIAHLFIFLALRSALLPRALINLIMSMCTDHHVYAVVKGSVKYMYPVHAGVLQGCPRSAALFVVALNIFLVCVRSHNIPHFIFRAAADDLGGFCNPYVVSFFVYCISDLV
jgi:hypothetical protein